VTDVPPERRRAGPWNCKTMPVVEARFGLRPAADAQLASAGAIRFGMRSPGKRILAQRRRG
jgi:hypothetical protein